MIFQPTEIVKYLTPSIRYEVGGFVAPSQLSFTITPATPPIKGSLLLIFMAASTTVQQPTSIPTGFTPMAGNAESWGLNLYVKVSDGTETSFTFTYGLSRGPAWYYHEWLNLDFWPVVVLPVTGLINPITSPWTSPLFNVPQKGVTFFCGAKNENALWNPSAPWNIISASGTQKGAWLIFNDFAINQSVTWSKSGGGTSAMNNIVVSFPCKKVTF
jgi:hypothetical protein